MGKLISLVILASLGFCGTVILSSDKYINTYLVTICGSTSDLLMFVRTSHIKGWVRYPQNEDCMLSYTASTHIYDAIVTNLRNLAKLYCSSDDCINLGTHSIYFNATFETIESKGKESVILRTYRATNSHIYPESNVHLMNYTRELDNPGFHKMLKNRFVLDGDLGNCKINIMEFITDELYVDIGGMDQKMYKPDSFIDFELPKSSSPNHLLAVYPKASSANNITIIEYEYPLHLRYQAPTDTGYAAVRVMFPVILINCGEAQIVSSDRLNDMYTSMPTGVNSHKGAVLLITIASIGVGILLIFYEVAKKLKVLL